MWEYLPKIRNLIKIFHMLLRFPFYGHLSNLVWVVFATKFPSCCRKTCRHPFHGPIGGFSCQLSSILSSPGIVFSCSAPQTSPPPLTFFPEWWPLYLVYNSGRKYLQGNNKERIQDESIWVTLDIKMLCAEGVHRHIWRRWGCAPDRKSCFIYIKLWNPIFILWMIL